MRVHMQIPMLKEKIGTKFRRINIRPPRGGGGRILIRDEYLYDYGIWIRGLSFSGLAKRSPISLSDLAKHSPICKIPISPNLVSKLSEFRGLGFSGLAKPLPQPDKLDSENFDYAAGQKPDWFDWIIISGWG